MMTKRNFTYPVLTIFLALQFGCAGSNSDGGVDTDESYGISAEIETTGPASKEDGVGRLGPSVSWDNDGAEVWSVYHQWTDITDEPGLAWSENSGLNWDEKYQAWVSSLEIEPLESGYVKETFRLTTPHGRSFIAPVLECAEVSIFMRSTFAAWYNLPFYLEAYDRGRPIYLGHFGFRNADGSLFSRTPRFSRAYKDFTRDWREGGAWPSDTKLKGRGLYGGGDEVDFLPQVNGQPARAGAYFDGIYLNKRIGHFMLLSLSWFGSMHLADGANMYHIKPEGIKAGDVLLERWQRKGIGHTIPVMRAIWPESTRLEVAVATGSMPRRYPKWEGTDRASRYFRDEATGGPGVNNDGDEFAKLGGGLRRWRVAVSDGSRYRNTFMPTDRALWINSNDSATLAARVGAFEEYLRPPTPEVRRDIAIDLIKSAREHLRRYPASCSARKNRESAFKDLREVMVAEFGMTVDQVDANHRMLEDYVFETLEYDRSVTCCWNSSNSNMFDIIMDYNHSLISSSTEPSCQPPLTFMARDRSENDDGYAIFRAHAEQLGRLNEWVSWSEDEACAQAASTVTDTIATMNALPYCQLSSVEMPGSTSNCGDAPEDNPIEIVEGVYEELKVCSTEYDFFTFTGEDDVKITVQSEGGSGTLNVAVFDSVGNYIAGSGSADDLHVVELTLEGLQNITIQLYLVGNEGDRSYTLTVE
jgi:hypothetical protein